PPAPVRLEERGNASRQPPAESVVLLLVHSGVHGERAVDPCLGDNALILPLAIPEHQQTDLRHVSWPELQVSPAVGDAHRIGRPLDILNSQRCKEMNAGILESLEPTPCASGDDSAQVLVGHCWDGNGGAVVW